MKKSIRSIAVVLGLLNIGAANAAGIKTLFLGADTGLNGVLTDLIGTDSRFDLANSAVFDAGQDPTLAYLEQFDSILFWSNYYPNSNIGDELADYVDAGGHVVISTFIGQEAPNSGRIMTTGYSPFNSGRFDAYNSASLGSFNASNSIMAGVTSINASTYRGDWNPSLDTGAQLIASWSDGRPFVGINASQNVIDISLFPNVVGYSHASGDYRQLFSNALAYSQNSTASVPEPATFALLSFGLVGLNYRRRKSSTQLNNQLVTA